jgi:surface protein
MFSMTNFNQDISQWDVSNVTKMNSMFYRSDYFNQPLHNWDVSNVTEMSYMFYITLNFNQDLINWGVENVTYCAYFSLGASAWTLPQPNFTNCNPN